MFWAHPKAGEGRLLSSLGSQEEHCQKPYGFQRATSILGSRCAHVRIAQRVCHGQRHYCHLITASHQRLIELRSVSDRDCCSCISSNKLRVWGGKGQYSPAELVLFQMMMMNLVLHKRNSCSQIQPVCELMFLNVNNQFADAGMIRSSTKKASPVRNSPPREWNCLKLLTRLL